METIVNTTPQQPVHLAQQDYCDYRLFRLWEKHLAAFDQQNE